MRRWLVQSSLTLGGVVILLALWRWNGARQVTPPVPRGPFRVSLEKLSLTDSIGARVVTTYVPYGPGPFPALLFAPGMGVQSGAYRTFLGDMASFGFVIVAVPHPRIPDADNTPLVVAQPIFARAIASALHATLEAYGAGDSVARKIDTTRIAAIGHSIGGAGAAEACSLSPRLRAAVDFDGSLYGTIVHSGVACPFLLIEQPPSRRMPFGDPPQFLEDRAQGTLHQDSVRAHTRVMRWVTISGLDHMSFTDAALAFKTRNWLRESLRLRVRDADAQRIAADLALDFLSTHLDVPGRRSTEPSTRGVRVVATP